ncbi:hypothetical protein [Deinococcus aluminii]|uniref:GNAT family N-acetyltransferase n=1 Tax=Deinococcus aluminii TaxID=1656885 RepID=A0ABP9XC82_9DEIO
MSLPPALTELIAYFEPLSTVRRDFRGAVTLHTPGVNVLALNATYLPDADPDRLPLVAAWHHAQDMPALVAASVPLPGEEVGAVRVGTYHPLPDAGRIDVEQVSRLSLPAWAAVLTEAHGTPEWAGPLARHLAARLEGDPAWTLLTAYAGGEAVGALLWRAGAEGGGAAHLWGTLDPAADAPLLNAAFGLGGGLRASLPDSSPLSVADETGVTFSLLGPPSEEGQEG